MIRKKRSTDVTRLTKFISIDNYEIVDELKDKDKEEIYNLMLHKLGELENIMQINRIDNVQELKALIKQASDFDDYICTIIAGDFANESSKNQAENFIHFLNYLIEKYEQMPFHLKDMDVKGQIIMAFIAEKDIVETYLKHREILYKAFLKESDKK